MKTFIVNDAAGIAVAFALDEATAIDVMFERAIQADRVDMTARTFDAAGDTVTTAEFSELLDSGLLTESQINDLETEGLVLI